MPLIYIDCVAFSCFVPCAPKPDNDIASISFITVNYLQMKKTDFKSKHILDCQIETEKIKDKKPKQLWILEERMVEI